MFTSMCDIFIMCFVLFLFLTCFEWNFNAMAATAAAAAAEEDGGSCCCSGGRGAGWRRLLLLQLLESLSKYFNFFSQIPQTAMIQILVYLLKYFVTCFPNV